MDDDIRAFINQLLILAGVVLLVSGPAWALVVRSRRGRPLLEYRQRRHVPWGFLDLLLLVGLWIVISAAAGLMVSSGDVQVDMEKMSPGQRVALVLASGAAKLAATIIAFLVIKTKCLARWSDFGIRWGEIRRDLLIGLVAFLMIAPTVFFVQFLVVMIWQKSAHPLIKMIMQQPDAMFFLVTGFSAVIVAPLFEEFLFRPLLQGWLEKIPAFRKSSEILLLGERADNSLAEQSVDMNQANEPADSKSESIEDPHAARPTVWPVFVSAVAFALMHFNHGTDPIPLFVLAIGIGYVYQRTHRILPCIMVHLLFNTTSLIMLLIYVFSTPKS